MKLIAMFTAVLALLLAGTAHAQDENAVSNAKAAAIQWLILVDSADYSATWEQSAGLFKSAVSKADWESAIRSVRTPLGAVKIKFRNVKDVLLRN